MGRPHIFLGRGDDTPGMDSVRRVPRPTLDQVAGAILGLAVGDAVGSRTVTRRHDLGLSPATVRNVMADLEDLGPVRGADGDSADTMLGQHLRERDRRSPRVPVGAQVGAQVRQVPRRGGAGNLDGGDLCAVQPTRELVLDAVLMAVRGSDQGGQYGSDGWQRFCRSNHLEPSMSRKGNCWDNAVVESFFSSLKKERIKKQIYKNRALALADVADYIDTFYNRTRRHGHLGGVSPEQFETAHRLRRHGLH